MSNDRLSDKALSIFAFAAFHQLESGQRVSSVIRQDGAGHQADPEGVAELEGRGLARSDDRGVHFTQEGERMLEGIVGAIRAA
jgi:hypothetical protein